MPDLFMILVAVNAGNSVPGHTGLEKPPSPQNAGLEMRMQFVKVGRFRPIALYPVLYFLSLIKSQSFPWAERWQLMQPFAFPSASISPSLAYLSQK